MRGHWIPKKQLIQEIVEEENAEKEDVEEDIDSLVEDGLMIENKLRNQKVLQLSTKFVYLKENLGMSFGEILESNSNFQPEDVADKVNRAKELLEQNNVSNKEKNEVVEIFSDPYVRALTEKEMGGGFEINLPSD